MTQMLKLHAARGSNSTNLVLETWYLPEGDILFGRWTRNRTEFLCSSGIHYHQTSSPPIKFGDCSRNRTGVSSFADYRVAILLYSHKIWRIVPDLNRHHLVRQTSALPIMLTIHFNLVPVAGFEPARKLVLSQPPLPIGIHRLNSFGALDQIRTDTLPRSQRSSSANWDTRAKLGPRSRIRTGT